MRRALLVVTGIFGLGGGIAKVNQLVVRSLAEASYDLDICSLLESKTQVDSPYPLGVRVQYLGYAGNKLAFSIAVWRSLISSHYDLVFCDHVNLGSVLAPLKFFDPGYLVWLHGAEVFPPWPGLEGRLGLLAAHSCLSSSDFTTQVVRHAYPKINIKTCELALDVDKLTPLEKLPCGDLLLPAVDGSQRRLGRSVILHVGRMETTERYKGHEPMISAFSLFQAICPDSQLVLAGDGDDRQRIVQVARSLPAELHHRIFIPGFVSAELLDQLYRVCYLFAMPSSGEGFGLVYLEAMARGKPCIGSALDAARTVIEDQVTGLLVADPADPRQIADAVLTLLNVPGRAQQMGLAGYERVKERYLFPAFKERFARAIGITEV